MDQCKSLNDIENTKRRKVSSMEKAALEALSLLNATRLLPKPGIPIKPGLSPFEQPKQWHDVPTAAVRRAVLILGSFPTGAPEGL